MLNNKADTIEDYILKRLKQNSDRQIELKRTEVADEVSCAPSQISYVLSTRFTTERGFVVESRRGLGGYIRIALIPEELDQKQMLYRDIMHKITAKTTFEQVKSMIEFIFVESKLITRREAELIAQMSVNLYRSEAAGEITGDERAKLIRSIFATLSKIT